MHKLLKNIRKKYRDEVYLLIIICFAFYLRTFNINWDNSYYFHPDERALIMITLPLHFPDNLGNLLTSNSTLNPHFFAYGSFPIYLLRILSEIFGYFNPILRVYGGIHIIGRLLSAAFDTGTVFIIYLICLRLFSKKIGVISSALYAFSVLPIQLSHFFAVDTILTFFMVSTLYSLIVFIEKPTIKNILTTGLLFGLALSTKISAAILISNIIIAFLIAFLHKSKRSKPKISLLLATAIIFISSTSMVFFLIQPYALIDHQEFVRQTLSQAQMSKDVFIFPYTLQYVGKIPYIYELKNIFFWGQGPLIAALSLLGLFFYCYKNRKRIILLFPAIYIIIYFFVFGKFAVGFIRYMLPIYPVLSIFGGWFVFEMIIKKIPKKYLKNYLVNKFLILGFITIIAIYPVSYISIYLHPNTRIQASDWINKNIPSGSKLAIEHWDDSLPVYGREQYVQLTLPLYDQDSIKKWQGINSTLKLSDYIIIASSRLYIPLQKLTDCNHLPPSRCYPITANYYKKLLSGKTEFKKIKEFRSEPTIPILNIEINDLSSDENFTVFDHPKIMIFKKE